MLNQQMDAVTKSLTIVGSIYEAAAVPGLWPSVLQQIADLVGAKGSAIITRSPKHADITFSNDIKDMGQEYLESGWLSDTSLAQPLYAEQYPGFRAESDYRTPEEIADLPAHREFLDPRGFNAGAATVFPGSADDILHITVEGFATHELSRAALPTLNALRPHLARAISLTNQIAHARDEAIVQSLGMIGAGIAIVDAGGRLKAVNDRFAAQLGADAVDLRARLHFTKPFLDAQFRRALDHVAADRKASSIGFRRDEGSPLAIHLIPLVGEARDVMSSDGILILVADPDNVSVPDAGLLKLLFDLTPVEALLANSLAAGLSLADIAAQRGVSEATLRTQLKAVFNKTGVTRQAGLIRLLLGIGIGK